MSGLKSWNAGKVGTAEIDAAVLNSQVKRKLLHAAVVQYEANRRQGTACTKTRGETNYSERKPYKQKGTGNARRGDRNSPLLRGGGVIFGPRPRDYRQSMPREALREALRSALTGKLADGEVALLRGAAWTEPSTKSGAAALRDLGCTRSVTVVLDGDQTLLLRSFRNIRDVAVVRASDLNAWDVLARRHLVFVDGAWDAVVRRLGPGKGKPLQRAEADR